MSRLEAGIFSCRPLQHVEGRDIFLMIMPVVQKDNEIGSIIMRLFGKSTSETIQIQLLQEVASQNSQNGSRIKKKHHSLPFDQS